MKRHKRKLRIAILREFFDYNPRTGDLRYKKGRAKRWFASDRLLKSWNAQFGGKIAGAISERDGYQRVAVNQYAYMAHRVIWAMMTGAWPKEEIDHINGVPQTSRAPAHSRSGGAPYVTLCEMRWLTFGLANRASGAPAPWSRRMPATRRSAYGFDFAHRRRVCDRFAPFRRM